MRAARLLPCPIACAALLALPARADVTLEFTIKETGSSAPVEQRALVKDNKVFIEAVGGSPDADMLFDAAKKEVVIISHRDKTLMELDEQKMEAIARQTAGMMDQLKSQMAEQLKNLPEDQRKQMEEMLGANMPGLMDQGQKKPVERELVTLDQTDTINGFDCRRYRVLEDGQPVAESCVAAREELDLSDSDYQTLRTMQDFARQLADRMQAMMGKQGAAMPGMAGASFDGVPVVVNDLSGQGSEVRLKSVQHDALDASRFQVPEGYRPVQMPGLGG